VAGDGVVVADGCAEIESARPGEFITFTGGERGDGGGVPTVSFFSSGLAGGCDWVVVVADGGVLGVPLVVVVVLNWVLTVADAASMGFIAGAGIGVTDNTGEVLRMGSGTGVGAGVGVAGVVGEAGVGGVELGGTAVVLGGGVC